MPKGYPFFDVDERTKRAVWERGVPVDGFDAAIQRKDRQGHWIRFDQHGKKGAFGWEIGQIVHRKWGDQVGWFLQDVQPLWWRNNRNGLT